jgi:hypothetical protein
VGVHKDFGAHLQSGTITRGLITNTSTDPVRQETDIANEVQSCEVVANWGAIHL